jgi:hypothetical protein
MKFYDVFTSNSHYIFGAETFMEAVDLVKSQLNWGLVIQIKESTVKAVILKEDLTKED